MVSRSTNVAIFGRLQYTKAKGVFGGGHWAMVLPFGSPG